VGEVAAPSRNEAHVWPPLEYDAWKETLGAIHMWAQIVGKIRLAKTPVVNHWWNSALVITPRGLGTGLVPSGGDGFQIDLDFVTHQLTIVTSRGDGSAFPLRAMAVADFYRDVVGSLARVGISDPGIDPRPNEVAVAVPFPEDIEVRPYDRERARQFAGALLRTYTVFERFRAGFLGKASPVQFFWGSFDLAAARFSGRLAPTYAGGTPPNVNVHVMHEAYSHELISAGFWPGNADSPRAEYYAYAMPAIERLAEARIKPSQAGWDAQRGEFLLSYDDVRSAADPASALLDFLQSTYDAAADLAHWDRALLEDSVRCECGAVPRRMRVGRPHPQERVGV
jgi:Family of unknown function (DUF5996)